MRTTSTAEQAVPLRPLEPAPERPRLRLVGADERAAPTPTPPAAPNAHELPRRPVDRVAIVLIAQVGLVGVAGLVALLGSAVALALLIAALTGLTVWAARR